jgi:hypothetical protein
MNLTLRYKIIFSILGIFFALMSIALYHPFIINISSEINSQDFKNSKKGDEIAVFDTFDFDSGNWAMYLCLSKDDKNELSPDMQFKTFSKTNNKKILQEIKKNWRFEVTESDISTVESEIILCRNQRIMFRSGIILDKDIQGLQSQQFGWIQTKNKKSLSKYCKNFQRVYSPILLFW